MRSVLRSALVVGAGVFASVAVAKVPPYTNPASSVDAIEKEDFATSKPLRGKAKEDFTTKKPVSVTAKDDFATRKPVSVTDKQDGSMVRHESAAPLEQAPTSPSLELQRLNEQGVLLSARLRNAKLQDEINRLTHTQSASPSPGIGAASGAESAVISGDDDRAVSISAYEGHFQARLHIAGRDITVRRGDAAGSGWTVSHIDSAGVTLVRGHERRVLRV
ncbi:type IV pilus biogenesis protein PilP [Paraburkholderia sp. J69-1]|uniref:type IV pilus biogenesis protein PilP n=1 Tax=Paraburkholderia sp. J69-1 TaxID=2805436 RepID=UPI002AB5F518|nr:type IV pilus biogenesis protein PilP [Paraburkholderia sp. J69-1]